MLRKSLKKSLLSRSDNGDAVQTDNPTQRIDDKSDVENFLEDIVIGKKESFLNQFNEPAEKKTKIIELSRQPAWNDDDDQTVVDSLTLNYNLKRKLVKNVEPVSSDKYKDSLKRQFEKIAGTPEWAQLDKEKNEGSDDENDLLQNTRNYIAGSSSLPRNVIQMKKCIDINKECFSQGKLKSVEFHPTAQVALCAGKNQTLNLFQVDGKINAKIQSIFIENFPIFTAHFTPNGEDVIMGSIHKSFYNYDMIAGKMINIPQIKGLNENNLSSFKITPDGKYIVFMGKYGHMHVISLKSKEWISTLKMNGSVDDICFNSSGTRMYSIGDDGDVYEWDLNSLQCIHRFYDDGCIQGSAVAISPNGKYLTTGSYSGVVNIYNVDDIKTRRPLPLKSIMNLTSPCTNITFNSSSEIIAMSSNYSEKGVKLVHVPSMSVFSNFPERADTMRIPMCMDFSVNSGYFAIGNHCGNALLYRVKHYENY